METLASEVALAPVGLTSPTAAVAATAVPSRDTASLRSLVLGVIALLYGTWQPESFVYVNGVLTCGQSLSTREGNVKPPHDD